jgi:SAM-dependent methyltransferase
VYSLLKTLLKFFIPKILLERTEPVLRKIVSAFFIGKKYECPVCGFHARKFISVHHEESFLCPRCGSIERKRLLWLYLRDELKINEQNNYRVLHFSPSSALFRKLSSLKNLEYVPAAFDNSLIKNHLDITSLPFMENHFDLIICYHILEHVADDKKAMSEIYRVLKAKGNLLVQVPFTDGETLEDSSVTNPEERKKLFGQEDHVRYYGKADFRNRLGAARFSVEEIHCSGIIGKDKIDLFKLSPNEIIFRCRKS